VDRIYERTATEIVELVQTRAVSRQEIVEAHAARIEAVNPAVNAFVDLRLEEALEEAKEADARPPGWAPFKPLDGVPLAIKNSHDVAGMATTMGIPSRAAAIAPRDKVIVQRLREAGGIVLGKANLPDLAIRWNTISSLHGTTRNPRDLERTAGGSSGGDAAAVAAGMAPIGVGSDYGGSIRVPATFCGIVGFRPTTGVVPDGAVLPPHDYAPSFDLMNSNGPLARSVDDLELAFSVLRGISPEDPGSVPAELIPPSGRPRIALLLTETGATVEADVEQEVRRTAELLRGEGYEVVEGAVPDLRRGSELWAEILGTELVQHDLAEIRDLMGAGGLQHIEAFHCSHELGPHVGRYLDALRERRALVRTVAAWMEDYPIVLAPVAGMTTPRLDFDDGLSVEETQVLFEHMKCVVWVNLLGLPGAALGNGAQIVGRRFADLEVLEVARVARRALGPVQVAAVAS
jgi:amidase